MSSVLAVESVDCRQTVYTIYLSLIPFVVLREKKDPAGSLVLRVNRAFR